jgi:hypothetical protein
LRNNSGAALAWRTFSHAFTVAAVSLQSGRMRSPFADDVHSGRALDVDLTERETDQL